MTNLNFSPDIFKRIRANTKDLLIIELQRVIEEKNNVIRGHKSFQTKLIRTLNK